MWPFNLKPRQYLQIGLAILGWVLVYIFQEFDYSRLEMRPAQYAEGNIPEGESWRFVINKSIRFLLNDLLSLLFIHGLFQKRNYFIVALLVMSFGMLILLPSYLILAIAFKESAFHLLTFLHRITMNPWLMLMLVPAFFYSDRANNSKNQNQLPQ